MVREKEPVLSRIDSLIAAMTLTEKLGQMTMMAADSATTGTAMTTDLDAGIRSGAIGNLLNLYGVEKTRAAQRPLRFQSSAISWSSKIMYVGVFARTWATAGVAAA